MIETVATRCCIAGGGPAGMMLGFLLARAGIDVIVLEKHKDFFRDFRGDTIHPSTLELMHELGLRAKTPAGDIEIQAALVVGCDGRHSTIRERAGFTVDDIGAPIDVLWFRLSRKASDTEETGGHIEAGRMLVMLNRGDYWQCAY